MLLFIFCTSSLSHFNDYVNGPYVEYTGIVPEALSGKNIWIHKTEFILMCKTCISHTIGDGVLVVERSSFRECISSTPGGALRFIGKSCFLKSVCGSKCYHTSVGSDGMFSHMSSNSGVLSFNFSTIVNCPPILFERYEAPINMHQGIQYFVETNSSSNYVATRSCLCTIGGISCLLVFSSIMDSYGSNFGLIGIYSSKFNMDYSNIWNNSQGQRDYGLIFQISNNPQTQILAPKP